MPTYFEFDVALREIRPRIWRRFLLSSTSTFLGLHRTIQASFGWTDSHLFEFRAPGDGVPLAGVPDADGWDDTIPEARRVKLTRYFTGQGTLERCEYLYDFGDDWEHDVTLVRAVSLTERFRQRLLGGERACPPEDCGGFPGYERMKLVVETGQDVYDEDPEHLLRWLGAWTPERFDAEAARARFDR